MCIGDGCRIHSVLFSAASRSDAVPVPQLVVLSAVGSPEVFLFCHPSFLCNAAESSGACGAVKLIPSGLHSSSAKRSFNERDLRRR